MAFLDAQGGIRLLLRRFHWNAEVMENLVDLAERLDFIPT
jgi:hypothetical protein